MTGPDGRPSQETTLNPALQQTSDNAFGNANTPLQRQNIPPQFENLMRALTEKVGKKYGMDSQQLGAEPSKRQFPNQAPPAPMQSTYGASGAKPLPYTPPKAGG